MRDLLRQFHAAARRLARKPGFALVAGVTLAVGIGANAAIFSVVDAVLLDPLPYPRPHELVQLGHVAPAAGVDDATQSQATYFTYRAENRTLLDVGIWSDQQVTVTGQGEPERLVAVVVTDGTLPLLGAGAAAGRLFTPADDAPGAPPTVLLGHGYWRRRFGGDPDAIGRSLRVDGVPREIVGVLSPGFTVVELDPEVYLPARFDPAQAQFGNFSYPGVARLRPGASLEEATADLTRLLPLALERHPGPITLEQIRAAGLAPVVAPLKQAVVGDVSTVLWVLAGTVGLVLLLACANVANLFLVQAELRHREVALRMALGAGRSSVAVGFLAEAVVLTAGAGLAGVGLAVGGLRLLAALGPQSLPRLHAVSVDGRALLFTAAVSLLAALAFGLLPAVRAGRADLQAALKEGGRGAGAGPGRHRLRNGLVVLQVALALVLLVGSGLMVRSVRALRDVDPGFVRPEEVVAFRLHVPAAEVPDPEAVARLEAAVLDRLREVPGVRSVGATSVFTMTGQLTNANPIAIEGRPIEAGTMPPVRSFRFVAPGYLETMGAPLVAGRRLTWADVQTRAPVVMINDALARAEWGEPAAAVGQRIRDFLEADWYEVVGVTGSIHYEGVGRPAPPVVYWPVVVARMWEEAPWVPRSLDYVVRTSGDPLALLPRLRDAVWAVNPNLPLASVRRVSDVLRGSMARSAFAMAMLSLAAAVALGLGLIGIYGVVSYVVSQRTAEIGVRVALGAAPVTVRRMVVGETARVIGLGVALGLAAAAGLTRLMAGLLFGVEPLDPLTFGLVTAAVLAVGLAASWLPARRAARVDPVTALRIEA